MGGGGGGVIVNEEGPQIDNEHMGQGYGGGAAAYSSNDGTNGAIIMAFK